MSEICPFFKNLFYMAHFYELHNVFLLSQPSKLALHEDKFKVFSNLVVYWLHYFFTLKDDKREKDMSPYNIVRTYEVRLWLQ